MKRVNRRRCLSYREHVVRYLALLPQGHSSMQCHWSSSWGCLHTGWERCWERYCGSKSVPQPKWQSIDLFFFFYKNFTYAGQLFTVPFLCFRFQRLQVATILHCLNYFLPTRGCNSHVCERCKFVKGLTKFTTSGAHDVIAITSPQKNDLCTEELQDRAQVMKLLSHWTRSVYHLEELDSFVYFLGRERGLWSWLWHEISPWEAVLVLDESPSDISLVWFMNAPSGAMCKWATYCWGRHT